MIHANSILFDTVIAISQSSPDVVDKSASQLFQYDPSIGIADTATALGVLGAALGYIINLIRNYFKDRKETKYRGTKLTIIQILEQALPGGLSEQEIRDQYNNKTEIIKKYSAWQPSRLGEVEFERELKQLQFYDRAIELVGADTYRLCHEPIPQYEELERHQTEVAAFVRANVPQNKLRETALRILRSSENESDIANAAKALMNMKDLEGLNQCLELLEGKNNQTAIRLVEEISGMMQRGR